MVLPQKLKYLRKQMGWSQLELAEKLQVSRQAVSGWESGNSKPSMENLKCLGVLYDVSLEYLFHDDVTDPVLQHAKKNIVTSGIGKKRWILMLIVIVISVAVVFYVVFLRDTPKTSMPMNEIERSEVTTDNKNDFELEF